VTRVVFPSYPISAKMIIIAQFPAAQSWFRPRHKHLSQIISKQSWSTSTQSSNLSTSPAAVQSGTRRTEKHLRTWSIICW